MNQPLPKYAQAAALVRALIDDGTLKPGQAAPSGDRLARLTGFSTLTCRRGLRTLLAAGVLVQGASPAARLRVPFPDGRQDTAPALSRALAARRRKRGLTQPELAAMTGYSVTAVCHAETGRSWQARAFWEKADTALDAGGEIIALYDARPRRARSDSRHGTGPPWPSYLLPPSRVPVSVSAVVVWSDGTVTTVPVQAPDARPGPAPVP